MHFLPIVGVLATSVAAFPLTLSFATGSQDSQFASLLAPGEKPIPGNSPVAICDIYEPKILTVDEVNINPSPPERGANLSFDAVGSLSKTIEEGSYVVVDVRYGFIKLLTKTFDLCEELTEVDLTCPILSGPQSIDKTVEIPDEVPPGTYTVYARAFTEDDDYIACLTASVTFSQDAYKMTDYLKFAKRMLFN